MKTNPENPTYIPTEAEKSQIKIHPGFLKVSGDGIFATHQGEGLTAGRRAVFLRLQHCNLACGNQAGWKCDTPYTWDRQTPEFWKEPYDLAPFSAATQIRKAWLEAFPINADFRVVVTGGEPMIQQRGILELMHQLPRWDFEIETNGTITPQTELADVQFNCSPKLSNSGNPLTKRYRPHVLNALNQLPKTTFKFVVDSPDDFEEIDHLVKDCSLSSDKILIMPEGQTADAVSQKAAIITTDVEKRGWQITLRNQLIWYGPKRRT